MRLIYICCHRNVTELIRFKEKGGKKAEICVGTHLCREKELIHTIDSCGSQSMRKGETRRITG